MPRGKEGGSASGESGRRTSRGSRSLVTGLGAQSARGEVERSTASHLIVCVVQKKSVAVLQMPRSGARCSDQTDASAEHGRSRAHVIASPCCLAPSLATRHAAFPTLTCTWLRPCPQQRLPVGVLGRGPRRAVRLPRRFRGHCAHLDAQRLRGRRLQASGTPRADTSIPGGSLTGRADRWYSSDPARTRRPTATATPPIPSLHTCRGFGLSLNPTVRANRLSCRSLERLTRRPRCSTRCRRSQTKLVR